MLIRVSRKIHVPVAAVSRRRFLGYSAGSAVILGIASCDSGEGGASDLPDLTGDSGGSEGKADNVMFEDGICTSGPTGDDALGPYWTPNIRETIQLATPEELGQRMMVFGHLYANDCVTPIPGATIVAWQADDEGLYDYNHAGLNQGSSQGVLSQEQTRLRGMFTTSVAGTYALETIFPSEYPLNLLDPENSAYRAPHIHFAIFFTDNTGAAQQLVTQMYFNPTDLVRSKVADIEMLNAQDGGASTAEPSRFITLDGSDRGIWHGQFDLVFDIDPSRVV